MVTLEREILRVLSALSLQGGSAHVVVDAAAAEVQSFLERGAPISSTPRIV